MDDLTALALAARDGDRVALAAFVRRAQPDVWRLCAALAGRAEADDLTQDAMVRVLRSLPSFRGESAARTWVVTIARRTVVDAVRSSARRRRLLARVPRPLEVAADHAGEVDLGLLLADLDGDQRVAFVLTQVVGLSYEEAAASCGCPIGTIRSRVARARSALAERHQAIA